MRVNSLTTRFLVVLLLCSAVPFSIFGLYVRSESRDREERQVVSVYLPRWAEDAARKISTALENARRVGWILARNAETYLLRRVDLAELEENIFSLYSVNEAIEMAILADPSGAVQFVARDPQLDADRRDELELLAPKSLRPYSWFRDVRDGDPERWVTRHLSPFLHREQDQRSKDPTNYSLGLAIHVPFESDEPARWTHDHGVLFLQLRWQIIQDVLDETTRFLREEAGLATASVFLSDENGRVLAHWDRERYGGELPENLRRTILKSEQPDGPVVSQHSFFTEKDGQTHGVGIAAIQSGFLGEGFKWRIGLHAPTRELFDVSREFGRWLLIIIPLIVLAITVLAVLSSRAIVRPVRLLSDATRQVAHGDLDARVAPKGGHELADLGRAFNTMAEDLAESRDQLRVAERQSAWAEMARQVAHEIKNPLTPMRMNAQMLLKAKRGADPRWQELSERLARNVIEQTAALDRIASDFRQFAGSPSRDVTTVRADELLSSVEELVSGMSEESGQSLEFVADAADALIAVDAQEMRRVFLNLIHNAMQACRDGVVQVRSSLDEEDETVEFRVVDDGVGIPEEMRGRLFDPYFTTKTSGTGLGLAICRRIVEAHGGDIVLESSAPPRTVFLVSLPRAAAESAGS